MTVKVAVIYYSATGTVHALAPAQTIDRNPRWRRHLNATRSVPVAALDDLSWADAYAFGTPTRFGTPAAQLKQFIDEAVGLWRDGALADKPVTAFTSAHNRHGGSEATILALGNVFYHWGALIVPPGFTDATVYAAGGNPYGTVATGGEGVEAATLAAARYQGRRLTDFTVRLKGAPLVAGAAPSA